MKTTDTHRMVSDSYTDMLRDARDKQSCCTSSPAARLAGYEEVEQHAEAVAELLDHIPPPTKLSFVSHSLGGLIANTPV